MRLYFLNNIKAKTFRINNKEFLEDEPFIIDCSEELMDLDLNEIITGEELESLECPTVEKQLIAWNDVLNSLSEDKLRSLIESLGFRYTSSQLVKENKEFNNNPYFLINAVEKKFGNAEKQFILKITDPHPFFKRKKTANEVSIINYLKHNSKIPVPIILSYSKNNKTSIIGCEYILMAKIKGKSLREEFKA